MASFTGNNGLAQRDEVLLRYDRLYAIKDREDVVTCALVDANQQEKILLKFKLPEDPAQKTRTLKELIKVGKAGEARDASEHLRNIENWAVSRGLEVRLCSPGDSGPGVGLDSIKFCSGYSLPSSPADRIDKRTNFRTGLALESADAVSELETKIPGGKIFAFLDFDNMSLANLAGFSNQVDAVLGGMSDAAKKSFREGAYEVFRRGGDEFVIILKDEGAESAAALGAFRDEVRRLKEEKIPADDSRLRNVEITGDLKLRAAELVRTYFETARDSAKTTADFRDFILERYKSRDLVGIEDVGALALKAVEADFLDAAAAGVESKARVMDFTLAAVRVDAPLTVNQIHRAHGTCEKRIFKNKLADNTGAVDVADIDPEIKERSAERALAREVDSEETDFDTKINFLKNVLKSDIGGFSRAEAWKAALEVERAASKDPALGSILRYPLVDDKPLQFVLDIHEPKEISITTVKLRGFSILNKYFGYERADEILRNVAELFAEECPTAVGVRNMGGMVAFAHSEPLNEPALRRLAENAENYLNITLNSERYDIEYAVRQALEARAGNIEPGSCPKLRELEIEHKRVMAAPDARFETIIGK